MSAITGMPEVDSMTPSQAFHAGLSAGKAEIERLRAAVAAAEKAEEETSLLLAEQERVNAALVSQQSGDGK